MNHKIKILIMLGLLHCVYSSVAQTDSAVKDFLAAEWSQPPKPQRLWIDENKKQFIEKSINPSQIKLSYRYWKDDEKTLWILDEIGKERDITTGIIIENHKVKKVEILVYRESRGGQVQNPQFTQQYKSKDLQSNFTKEIDSISGATLSVRAVNKQVELALWLDSQL